MSVLQALIDDATPDELRELAERLRPLLTIQSQTDGWLRGASEIANYIGCPPSRIYALSSVGRLPAEHDGSALIARRSDLDHWICQGGGKRP